MILGTKNSNNGIGLNDRWKADKGLGSKLAYFMKHVRDHTPKGNVKQWICTLFITLPLSLILANVSAGFD